MCKADNVLLPAEIRVRPGTKHDVAKEVPAPDAEEEKEASQVGGGGKTGLAFVFSKLATREDPFMVHKIGGIFALYSFVYRYCWVWPTNGSLNFTGTPFDWLTMFMHLMLSSSAIQFRVPSKRQPRRPTMIWHEYRLHAIVFTAKAVALFVLAGYSLNCGAAVRFAFYCGFHLIVDMITHYHGTAGQTTIRGRDQTLNPFIT
jgi:hypothetical protein